MINKCVFFIINYILSIKNYFIFRKVNMKFSKNNMTDVYKIIYIICIIYIHQKTKPPRN